MSGAVETAAAAQVPELVDEAAVEKAAAAHLEDLVGEDTWLRDGTQPLVTVNQFVAAAATLIGLRRWMRELDAKHDAVVSAAHKAHKAAVAAKQAEIGADTPGFVEQLVVRLAAYIKQWALPAPATSKKKAVSLVKRAEMLPEVPGLNWSVKYKAVIEDPLKLLNAVARKRVPLDALAVNDSWVNKEAGRLHEAFSLPGCRLEVVVIPAITVAKADEAAD